MCCIAVNGFGTISVAFWALCSHCLYLVSLILNSVFTFMCTIRYTSCLDQPIEFWCCHGGHVSCVAVKGLGTISVAFWAL